MQGYGLIAFSNIDRQLAIWQTLNKTKWFDGLSPDDQQADGELPPFHTKDNKIFKSDDVKNWTKYGYQYEILVRRLGETEPEYIKRIEDQLAKDYNHSGKAVLDAPTEVTGTLSQQASTQQVPLKASTDASESEKTYPDYIADVIYDR
jgi:hypothetical protein